MLVVFSVYWVFTFRNREGFYFSCLVGVLWVGFNLWRYLYFGDLSSNTAHAQGITLDERLDVWTNWDWSELLRSYRIAAVHGALPFLIASPLLLVMLRSRVRERQNRLAFLLLGTLMVTSCLTPLVFGQAPLGLRKDHNPLGDGFGSGGGVDGSLWRVVPVHALFLDWQARLVRGSPFRTVRYTTPPVLCRRGAGDGGGAIHVREIGRAGRCAG